MKKVLSITLSIILVCLSTTSVWASSDIDALLAPYLEVIEKVNQEVGSSIYVPEEEKEGVYNYYKDMSLEEFEQTIKNEYLLSSNYNNYSEVLSVETIVVDNSKTRSITENIVQTKNISHNSYVRLYSTVIGSGNPIKYKYKTLNTLETGPQNGNTGYFFVFDEFTVTLNSTKTSCTVYMEGVLKNSAGLTLLVAIPPITVVFYAN